MMDQTQDLKLLLTHYISLEKQLQKNYQWIVQMKSTLLTLTLSEAVIESVPQCTTMITIILNQLSTGYPRMQMLFDSFANTIFGINGSYLCITFLILTFGGYSSTTLETSWRPNYPMSSGIPGGLTIIIGHMLYLVSKILMLSTVLSSAPYVSSLIIAAELGCIAIYLKIKKQPLQLTNVLVAGFSFSHFLHQEVKERGPKKKCFAIISALAMHVLHACLVSLPTFLIFRFVGVFDRFRSVHSDEMQLCVIAAFMISVLPLLAFIHLFEGKMNRWNLLKNPAQTIENIAVPQANRGPIGVCPIQPDVNFTVKNKGEIAMKHQKFKETRQEREDIS